MSAIKCKQCGHDNDLTRVFCQNCGGRLERPQGASGPTISGPSKVPTGPRKLKKQGAFGPVLAKIVRGIVSAAFLGALLALLIQMSRPPVEVPPVKPVNEGQATQSYQMLVSLAEGPYGRGYDLSQDQINNYLAARIVAGVASEGSGFRAQFQRAFVVIRQGEMSFFIEQKFFGVPVYMYLSGTLERSGSTIAFKPNGGGVGHVRFAPQLVPLLEKVIAPVVASVSDVAAVIQSADAVTLVPGIAKITWSGKKAQGN